MTYREARMIAAETHRQLAQWRRLLDRMEGQEPQSTTAWRRKHLARLEKQYREQKASCLALR
jgi:hypothetical protein